MPLLGASSALVRPPATREDLRSRIRLFANCPALFNYCPTSVDSSRLNIMALSMKSALATPLAAPARITSRRAAQPVRASLREDATRVAKAAGGELFRRTSACRDVVHARARPNSWGTCAATDVKHALMAWEPPHAQRSCVAVTFLQAAGPLADRQRFPTARHGPVVVLRPATIFRRPCCILRPNFHV